MTFVTILSYEKYHMKLDPHSRPLLERTYVNLTTADDSLQRIYGQCDVNLGILTQKEASYNIIVADIGAGLLGIDFIRFFNCGFYTEARMVTCCGEQVLCGDVQHTRRKEYGVVSCRCHELS